VLCQHLLRPIKSTILADTNISAKPKYLPIILARPIYWSISTWKCLMLKLLLRSRLADKLICSKVKQQEMEFCYMLYYLIVLAIG